MPRELLLVASVLCTQNDRLHGTQKFKSFFFSIRPSQINSLSSSESESPRKRKRRRLKTTNVDKKNTRKEREQKIPEIEYERKNYASQTNNKFQTMEKLCKLTRGWMVIYAMMNVSVSAMLRYHWKQDSSCSKCSINLMATVKIAICSRVLHLTHHISNELMRRVTGCCYFTSRLHPTVTHSTYVRKHFVHYIK
jgi:hypothetical protein